MVLDIENVSSLNNVLSYDLDVGIDIMEKEEKIYYVC